MDDKYIELIYTNVQSITKEWTPKIEEFLNQDNKYKSRLQIGIRLILIKVFAERSLNQLSDDFNVSEINKLIEELIINSTETITIIKL